MRRTLLLWVLALSLSGNVAVAAIALGRRALPRGVPAEPLIFSKVSLDPEQRARILMLREDLLAHRGEQASQLAELREKLAGLLTADAVDLAAVDALLGEIEARQASFQRRVVDHVLAVRAVLHPDQRPRFRALVTENMRSGAPLDPATPFAAAAQCGARR